VLELPSPCLVVLVGPAGSGKTTWATTHLAEQVVSSDSMRLLVGEGEDDLRASADAFAVLDDVVARRMRRRLTTVIDSLGTDPDRRAAWRAMAVRHDVPCIAVLFDVPPAQVRRMNTTRAKRVPDAVLRTQLAAWPTVMDAVRAEPFDRVEVIQPDVGAALVAPAMVRRSRATVTQPASAPEPRALTFGLQIPQFTWPGGAAEIGPRLRDIAQRAEAAGFDTLWVMDHVRQIPQMGPPWHDMLESWTALAHLAACTSTIRLGTLVTGVTHRHVTMLGKIVATLDVLSGGRVTCGLGLGWYADEHHAYGWPFPSVDERYALLEDALQLLPQMWGPGGKPFSGRALQVPDTSCYPRPLQAHVPMLVGGSGERRTLRLVARFADACNLFGDPAVVATKVRALHGHCATFDRDPTSISVSHLSTVLVGDDQSHVDRLVDATRPPKVSAERHRRTVNAGTIEQHVTRIERYVEAGVDQVIVSLVDVADPSAVDRYGVVIAACRAAHVVPI